MGRLFVVGLVVLGLGACGNPSVAEETSAGAPYPDPYPCDEAAADGQAVQGEGPKAQAATHEQEQRQRRYHILEMMQRSADPDAQTPPRLPSVAEPRYEVYLVNKTQDTLDQVTISWTTRDGSLGQASRYNIEPGGIAGMGLGRCAQLESYTLAAHVGDEIVANLPPAGRMTPVLASQYHPEDQDPCGDYWTLEAEVGPSIKADLGP